MCRFYGPEISILDTFDLLQHVTADGQMPRCRSARHRPDSPDRRKQTYAPAVSVCLSSLSLSPRLLSALTSAREDEGDKPLRRDRFVCSPAHLEAGIYTAVACMAAVQPEVKTAAVDTALIVLMCLIMPTRYSSPVVVRDQRALHSLADPPQASSLSPRCMGSLLLLAHVVRCVLALAAATVS